MGTNYFVVIPVSLCPEHGSQVTKTKRMVLKKSSNSSDSSSISDNSDNSDNSSDSEGEDNKLQPFIVDYEQVDVKTVHLCKVSAGWPVSWDLQGIELVYNMLIGTNDNSNKLEITWKPELGGIDQVCFTNIGFQTILDTIGDNEDVCFRTETYNDDNSSDMDWVDVKRRIGETRMYGEQTKSLVSPDNYPFYAYTVCNGKKYWFFLDPNPIDKDWARSW